jgi:hypothetical protein
VLPEQVPPFPEAPGLSRTDGTGPAGTRRCQVTGSPSKVRSRRTASKQRLISRPPLPLQNCPLARPAESTGHSREEAWEPEAPICATQTAVQRTRGQTFSCSRTVSSVLISFDLSGTYGNGQDPSSLLGSRGCSARSVRSLSTPQGSEFRWKAGTEDRCTCRNTSVKAGTVSSVPLWEASFGQFGSFCFPCRSTRQ